MNKAVTYNVEEIISKFDLSGIFCGSKPYGTGHINNTFEITFNSNGERVRYILQRINHYVFKEPEKVMENISRICGELQKQLKAEGVKDPERRSLITISAKSGLEYFKDDEGNIWRVYNFIEGAVGYDVIENEEQAYQAARAFGEFQKLLTGMGGERLHETIPGFHDTRKRYNRFMEVMKADKLGLAAGATHEIEFYSSYESEVGRLLELEKAGLIPERVTHNDTKLNNVLIDVESHEAICVIDLDTCMPGLALYDFGDLVRTSTTSAAEDEKDLSKIEFLPEMFKALVRGYLNSGADFLTEAEVENMVFSGILMTYETGVRFLTDYLEGSVYYKTAYDEHNLVRCRTQMRLVQLIEERQNELETYVLSEYKRLKNC